DWLAAAPAVAGQPAGAATASGVIPLATGQANYVGATGSTICVVTWWVDGPLAVDTLAAALGDVHRRHQALHAAYRTAPPGATLPARPGAPALQVLTGVGDDATALAAVNAALLEPLDVAAGRVWRAVVAPAGGRHLVGVGIHHIAFDGYSEEILARELSQAYAARAAGTAPAWSAPAPTLAQLANRSTARMRPDDLAQQSRYWQRQLRDLPRLRLPGAPRGPVPPAGPTAGIRLPIPAEVFAPWDARARQRRVSQFSYLVAVFGEVLRELTGQRDVGVLVPMSLRGDPLLDAAITCRANPVVLRLRPAPEGGDAWATTATAVGEALAAQDLPFGEVVGAVARVRPDLDALLNLPIFVVQDRQEEQLTLPGCAVHRIADRQAADVPSVLAIDLALTAAGADLNVGVRTDLVDLTFAERVGEAYQRILAAGPDAFSRRHAGADAALVAG
ncbi:MAG TPA: condensation domain-containing protein, partial [Rugosimonospora sp.]|nr:condensation domain-containing protein [Rugosimonospora sp.]